MENKDVYQIKKSDFKFICCLFFVAGMGFCVAILRIADLFVR